ncbi:MAG TPA: hypothetical protein VHW24_14850 [Bryobacteraceae bacterium]|jgi:hypothetical protein|nr:hypothetical protein [Bryobacteraceae bacterium]
MPNSRDRISRRRFGVRAALAGSLLPAAAQAQQGRGAPLDPPQAAEVESRYNEAIRKYGSRLNDQQKQRIRTILTANERMLSHIREFPLDNGDTPATILKLAEGK